MNEVPDTEWFSAYLDGELTADEQLRVEKMLAVSPEARQLLEEFRALGHDPAKPATAEARRGT